MNEKKPTWTCPVCDSPAKYDDLMVDGYFQVCLNQHKCPESTVGKYQLGTKFMVTLDKVVMLVSQEVIKAEELPDEENEIILNQVLFTAHNKIHWIGDEISSSGWFLESCAQG